MGDALKSMPSVGSFPDSPLLTNPEQVKQILAGASTPLLAEHGMAAARISSETSGTAKTARPGNSGPGAPQQK